MSQKRPKRPSTSSDENYNNYNVTKPRKIEFNNLHIKELIKNTQDAQNVENVVQMIMAVTYPSRKSTNYELSESDDHYNVVVAFPPDTKFTIAALSAIEQVNVALVEEVSVGLDKVEQNTNGVKVKVPAISVSATIRKTDSEFPFTVETVELIQRRIKGTRYRRIRNVEDIVVSGEQTDDNNDSNNNRGLFGGLFG